MDNHRRETVLVSIIRSCEWKAWQLFATHVRTNHFHVVVEAAAKPDFVINFLKRYASRALNGAGLDRIGCVRWTRGGSCRYLWAEASVESAIGYVLWRQGTPMSRYPSGL